MPDDRASTGIRGRARQAPRLRVEVVHTGKVRAVGLGAWLQRAAPAAARGRVTVAVVSDARVRALNRRYRLKDAVTDVLSFWGLTPTCKSGSDLNAPDTPTGKSGSDPDVSSAPAELGDVVIAAGVARRQARAAGHSVQTELRVLALHGLLHLLGYDHERDGGRMARLERRLRRRSGLPEGLIERAQQVHEAGRAASSVTRRRP